MNHIRKRQQAKRRNGKSEFDPLVSPKHTDPVCLIRNSITADTSFPSPYHFASNTAEVEALARRAARFQKPAASGPSNDQPRGVGGWFARDEDDDGAFVMTMDMIPGQVGRKKMKGKGGLGYSGVEVMEVDPVSLAQRPRSFPDLFCA